MTLLDDMVRKSGLLFLEGIRFDEVSKGRFFSPMEDLGNGWRQFYVVLEPSVEGPIHNHAGQRMEETHLLLYGSGKFIVYDCDVPKREIVLVLGRFHEVFSTATQTPDHKYVAGADGSITLALEKHY